MQKLFFIPNQRWPNPEKRDSAIMRAYMIAHYMKQKFSDKIFVECKRSIPDYAKSGDIVIFVKDDFHTDIKKAKSKGCITILDPCDMITFSHNSSQFDIVISAGKTHSEWLSRKMSIDINKCIVIDHLHTNISRLKANERETDSKVIIGATNYDDHAMIGKEKFIYLKNSIDKKSEISNYNLTKNTNSRCAFSIDYANNTVVGLYDCYKHMHIGLNLFDIKDQTFDPNDKSTNRVTIKPSVKLIAMASYGIPSISYYQSSYDKFIEKYKGFENFIAKDVDDVIIKINKLVCDFDYYLMSKKMFSQIGEDFHMDNSYEFYVKQINNFINKR